MPLFEYSCTACKQEFELLVRHDTQLVCPVCKSDAIERISSLNSVRSATTHDLSMRAARKRDAGQARDRMYEQLKYEESHDRHG